nr:hypothetical protein HMPREF0276_1791 [Corynebacterium accolens ATCC 49725]
MARSPRRAHPRSRGEHQALYAICCAHFGSSPLTRGARTSSDHRGLPGRLIPAHAGSTGDYPPEVLGCWAHPRSRGEHASE